MKMSYFCKIHTFMDIVKPPIFFVKTYNIQILLKPRETLVFACNLEVKLFDSKANK